MPLHTTLHTQIHTCTCAPRQDPASQCKGTTDIWCTICIGIEAACRCAVVVARQYPGAKHLHGAAHGVTCGDSRTSQAYGISRRLHTWRVVHKERQTYIRGTAHLGGASSQLQQHNFDRVTPVVEETVRAWNCFCPRTLERTPKHSVPASNWMDLLCWCTQYCSGMRPAACSCTLSGG